MNKVDISKLSLEEQSILQENMMNSQFFDMLQLEGLGKSEEEKKIIFEKFVKLGLFDKQEDRQYCLTHLGMDYIKKIREQEAVNSDGCSFSIGKKSD